MDFSITPGWTGYICWRLGLVDLWWRQLTPRLPKPETPEKWREKAAQPTTLKVAKVRSTAPTAPATPVAPAAPAATGD
jgi:hypothetical protein